MLNFNQRHYRSVYKIRVACLMRETTPPPGCMLWLLLVTCILILFQITNAITVLQLEEYFASSVSIPAWLTVILSLIWAGLFSTLALRLVRKQQYTIGYAVRLFIAFAIYSLLRLILFTRADYDRNRLPFLIIITVIALIIAFGIQRLSSGNNPESID